MSEKPIVVGLTGQTGAGKTTISNVFAEMGYAVINADLVSREVSDDPNVLAQLEKAFGHEIIRDDGKLDRRKLASLVFGNNKERLRMLEAILYPPIRASIKQKIDSFFAEGKRFILLDAPTLFEAGAEKLCTHTVSVLADAAQRRERIMARDGLSFEEAQARMDSQPNDAFYRRRSEYLLYNNGTQEELAAQGKMLASRLMEQKKSRSVLLLTLGVLLAILLLGGGYTLLFRGFFPQKYSEPVSRYAEAYQVEETLIYAVIKCESGFKPNAVSSAEARGLMQLTEDAYDWVKGKLGETDEHSYDDLFDPELNIKYGVKLLSLLLEEFDTPREALAAYHAGWGNVKNWLADPEMSSDGQTLDEIPFPTTNRYVRDVLQAQEMYEKLY